MIDTYLAFVKERHAIWERRQAGEPPPWTNDPILASRKFCNVYRIHDHGTQFVMKLIDESQSFHDCLMRCFLYRYTNRPEPWEHFKRITGAYPTVADLHGRLQTVWGTYSAAGNPIFGSAYKMFSGSENKGMTRLGWALDMTQTWITQFFANQFLLTSSMEARFNLLKTIPRCADFMAMQILTDVGYSPWIRGDENAFVAAGPGAIVGAKHVLPTATPVGTIETLADIMPSSLSLSGLDRPPSLMDVQNTLCEFGKYIKWAPRAKPYEPQHKATTPVYPEHWKRAKHEQLSLQDLL